MRYSSNRTAHLNCGDGEPGISRSLHFCRGPVRVEINATRSICPTCSTGHRRIDCLRSRQGYWRSPQRSQAQVLTRLSPSPRGFTIPERTVLLIDRFLAQNGATFRSSDDEDDGCRTARSQVPRMGRSEARMVLSEDRTSACSARGSCPRSWRLSSRTRVKPSGRRGRLPLTMNQIEAEIERKFRGAGTVASDKACMS